MPNAAGRALSKRRSRSKKAAAAAAAATDTATTTAVAETPETEYSSDSSTEDTTTDNATDKEETMGDWDEWGDNGEDSDSGAVATLEHEHEHEHDDGDLPDFASMVEDAPADYTPQRASAGRKREPSQFDDIVANAKNQGWKRVPHGGDDGRIKVIKRQLQKAQHWHQLGMDLNITDTHVEFNVRDKQARTKKSDVGGAGGQTALDEQAQTNGEFDPTDRDE